MTLFARAQTHRRRFWLGSLLAPPLTAAHDTTHVGLVIRDGEHVIGCYHIENVNAYTSRSSSGWRFSGVATKHRKCYLCWRREIERDGDLLTPRHCVATAMG